MYSIRGVYSTPLFPPSPLLWSDPVGARQLRAKALRRRAPQALLRKMTYKDKASYGSSPPCTMTLLCNMTHSYVWYDSFLCVPRLIHIQCQRLQVSLIVSVSDSFILNVSDKTHSYYKCQQVSDNDPTKHINKNRRGGREKAEDRHHNHKNFTSTRAHSKEKNEIHDTTPNCRAPHTSARAQTHLKHRNWH